MAPNNDDRRMNPDLVPEPLRALVPLFEKWGEVRSDTARYALASKAKANPADMKELGDLQATIDQLDLSSCQVWLAGSLSENYERAKIYFTFMLLGDLGMN